MIYRRFERQGGRCAAGARFARRECRIKRSGTGAGIRRRALRKACVSAHMFPYPLQSADGDLRHLSPPARPPYTFPSPHSPSPDSQPSPITAVLRPLGPRECCPAILRPPIHRDHAQGRQPSRQVEQVQNPSPNLLAFIAFPEPISSSSARRFHNRHSGHGLRRARRRPAGLPHPRTGFHPAGQAPRVQGLDAGRDIATDRRPSSSRVQRHQGEGHLVLPRAFIGLRPRPVLLGAPFVEI